MVLPLIQTELGPQWGAAIGASLVAAVWDVRTRRIPNKLTGTLLMCGLAWAVWSRGLAGLGGGVLGCLLMATPFVLLFLFANGGAADAKLMGALGMWLGVRDGVVVLTAVTVMGACMGIIYAIARRQAARVTTNLWTMGFGVMGMLRGEHKWRDAAKVFPAGDEMLPVPYGVAIFTGVCIGALCSGRIGMFL